MNFSISSILLRGYSTSYLFLRFFRFLDFNFQISICYDAYCFWIVFYKWERILEYLEWKLRSIVYMHFFLFQVKNRTSVSGQNANGDSPEATN